jgi:hypothetical protein
LYAHKILESIQQKGPEPQEPGHMVIVKEEEDKKTSAVGRPAKLEQGFLAAECFILSVKQNVIVTRWKLMSVGSTLMRQRALWIVIDQI